MPPRTRPVRIALVGERSAEMHAHSRYLPVMDALRRWDRLRLDAYWISTAELAQDADRLRRFDGVWLTPGSPYRSEAGAVAAARVGREHDVPFLATCGGFSHVLLEYARHVCGLTDAAHPDYAANPATEDPAAETAGAVVSATAQASAARERRTILRPGSLAADLTGVTRTVERYLSAHEIVDRHAAVLEAHGLRFTGHDSDGRPCVAELPERRFFLATSFQPELTVEAGRPHPIIRAFGAAAHQERT